MAAPDDTDFRPSFVCEFSFDDAAVEAGWGAACREKIVEAMPPVAAEKPSGMSDVPKLWDTRLRRLPKVGEEAELAWLWAGEEASTGETPGAAAVSMGGGKGSLVVDEVAIWGETGDYVPTE